MRKNSEVPISVELAIVGVIRSLVSFEADYTSLLRCPTSIDKERIHTFQQYIECRLNNEFFYIPEIKEAVDKFDGYLLTVTSVTQPKSPYKNRFTEIRAEINLSCSEYVGDNIEEDIRKISSFIGGTRIVIISAPRIPKIVIN